MQKLFFTCSLLITGFFAFGQDSLASQDPRPPSFFLSLDYGKVATLPLDFETKMEAGMGFRIGKHLSPVVYGGISTLNPENAISNGSYESSGWYLRAGLEYTLFIDQRNSFILGLRYAQSTFTEDAAYTVTSELFDNVTGELSREDLNARWAEVVIGSEMRMGESRFYMGGYFTLRILAERDEFSPVDTYAIPGYGRTTDKTVPALQLYMKFALIR
ncbi:MAG: DUF6048 family protein [Cyclobacteriaceae bacterium]